MVRWDYGLGVKEDFVSRGQNALHYTQVSISYCNVLGSNFSTICFKDFT